MYIYSMARGQTLSALQLVYSSTELQKLGFSYYQISNLVEQNKLVRLNKSHYENAEFVGDMNDFYYVPAFVPEGVICLMSAAVYYNLTTFRPYSIDVAVPSKKKLSSFPQSVNISLHYFSKERLSLGVCDVQVQKNTFKYTTSKRLSSTLFQTVTKSALRKPRKSSPITLLAKTETSISCTAMPRNFHASRF